MTDAPELQHADNTVSAARRNITSPPSGSSNFRRLLTCLGQEVDETPDYTDSDTNPNTTASSVAGDADGRRKRSEANQLRRSIFGKKHDRLGESKACG
jgi:hypothetical protein